MYSFGRLSSFFIAAIFLWPLTVLNFEADHFAGPISQICEDKRDLWKDMEVIDTFIFDLSMVGNVQTESKIYRDLILKVIDEIKDNINVDIYFFNSYDCAWLVGGPTFSIDQIGTIDDLESKIKAKSVSHFDASLALETAFKHLHKNMKPEVYETVNIFSAGVIPKGTINATSDADINLVGEYCGKILSEGSWTWLYQDPAYGGRYVHKIANLFFYETNGSVHPQSLMGPNFTTVSIGPDKTDKMVELLKNATDMARCGFTKLENAEVDSPKNKFPECYPKYILDEAPINIAIRKDATMVDTWEAVYKDGLRAFLSKSASGRDVKIFTYNQCSRQETTANCFHKADTDQLNLTEVTGADIDEKLAQISEDMKDVYLRPDKTFVPRPYNQFETNVTGANTCGASVLHHFATSAKTPTVFILIDNDMPDSGGASCQAQAQDIYQNFSAALVFSKTNGFNHSVFDDAKEEYTRRFNSVKSQIDFMEAYFGYNKPDDFANQLLNSTLNAYCSNHTHADHDDDKHTQDQENPSKTNTVLIIATAVAASVILVCVVGVSIYFLHRTPKNEPTDSYSFEDQWEEHPRNSREQRLYSRNDF